MISDKINEITINNCIFSKNKPFGIHLMGPDANVLITK